MKPIHLLQPVLLSLAVAGCSSIASTHLERDLEGCGWTKTHLHGIPTTLEVPHHFKISVIDTYYEQAGNILRDSDPTKMVNGKPALLSTRRVDLVVESTKEIFTVDFVRPAAGTLTT